MKSEPGTEGRMQKCGTELKKRAEPDKKSVINWYCVIVFACNLGIIGQDIGAPPWRTLITEQAAVWAGVLWVLVSCCGILVGYVLPARLLLLRYWKASLAMGCLTLFFLSLPFLLDYWASYWASDRVLVLFEKTTYCWLGLKLIVILVQVAAFWIIFELFHKHINWHTAVE